MKSRLALSFFLRIRNLNMCLNEELINLVLGEREERNMSIFRKWIKVTEKAESDKIEKLLDKYDKTITDCVNLIPLSEVINSSEDDGMKQLLDAYKGVLDLTNDAFDIVIEQDNRIRHIEKQNEEILKKLDEISKKTTK